VLRRATKADDPTGAGSAEPVGTARLLVVNDDPGACELLVRLLTRAGHEVERAHNHDQAMGQLAVGRFDYLEGNGLSHFLDLGRIELSADQTLDRI